MIENFWYTQKRVQLGREKIEKLGIYYPNQKREYWFYK